MAAEVLISNQFFDFHSGELVKDVALPSSIVSITLQRDSGLLAVICDDLVVRIVDVETRRIVRELRGFKGRVLDLVSSSLYDIHTLWLDDGTCTDILAGLPVACYYVPRLDHPNL